MVNCHVQVSLIACSHLCRVVIDNDSDKDATLVKVSFSSILIVLPIMSTIVQFSDNRSTLLVSAFLLTEIFKP